MKHWPLAISPLTVVDRLRVGAYLLRGGQLTAAGEVRRYEEWWEDYTKSPHAIMVSNGSVANELIARLRKQQLLDCGAWPKRNKVIFPACTWSTSVAPWLMLGFQPVWADVSHNLCVSQDEIARIFDRDAQREIGTVFYTTLLGQAGSLYNIRRICEQRGVELMLDNCESSFSWTAPEIGYQPQHYCAVGISSTSFYFSHPATTGTEGGMIFCSKETDADWFRMMRNHGLTRGMPAIYRNADAHPAFDFNCLGTNARSTDLQAYMGSLTVERQFAFVGKRIELAIAFYGALCHERFCDVTMGRCSTPLMALPIVPSPTHRSTGGSIQTLLDRLGVEHRPVVGGNLLRHTAFLGFGDPKRFPRADWLHDHGLYVGLHEGVTTSMVLELAEQLNLLR